MYTYLLTFEKKHLFVEIEDRKWLLDTGAPRSFGDLESLKFVGREFSIAQSYMGLSSEMLSEYVNIECHGLLGADLLGDFDHLFDISKGTLTVSVKELVLKGQYLPLSEFMGIPIVRVKIRDKEYQMFFDTGAQISYLQDDLITQFSKLDTLTDFYPGFGQFETETYEVEMRLGDTVSNLQCGTLPDLLGVALAMGGTQGILGNQILLNHIVGYFPRRNRLCL
jgi:hypothetical protein